MNKFKRITCFLLLAIAVMFSFSIAGCGGTGGIGSSKASTSDVDIENADYGFIKAEDYDINTTTIADTVKYQSLDAGTEYYLIVQFDIASRVDNDGLSLLTVDIELDDIDVMTGTIVDSNGVSIPIEFVDANTGNNALIYTTDFKIPDTVDKVKTVYMIMQLVPVTSGQSHIYLILSADDFNIYGFDGFTKNLSINAIQLDTPVLTWTQNTMTLMWNQIKYADYYLIYVDGDLLKDSTTGLAVSVEADENVAVGGEMLYTGIWNYVSNYHSIRIQACSYSSDIFKASSYSNTVEIDI